MSEYQFYQFKAIDKPLSEEEKATISTWSSRAIPSNTSVTFEYSYSDFPKNEIEVVETYFDAMFYFANWGEIRLIFKFPIGSVDIEAISPYFSGGIKLTEKKDCILLIIDLSSENSRHVILDDKGVIGSLIPLRNDILYGDYRCLYLVWLKINSDEELSYLRNESRRADPEVPVGLDSITGALADFMDVFAIEKTLIPNNAIQAH